MGELGDVDTGTKLGTLAMACGADRLDNACLFNPFAFALNVFKNVQWRHRVLRYAYY